MTDIEKQIEERIEKITQDESFNVVQDTLTKYLFFLKEKFSLPHKVTGTGNYFTYSEYKDKTPSGNQEFEIIGFEEDVENYSNIFVKVKQLNDEGEIFSLQLFEFKSIDSNSIESRILTDYTYWIENYL